MTNKILAIFARAPRAGEVKTRLAQHAGNEEALYLYIALLQDTLAAAQRAAQLVSDAETACEVVLFYTPADAFEANLGAADSHSLSVLWRGARYEQSEGDIGQRMLQCLNGLLEQGSEQVVLIGSDTPDLDPEVIARAFEKLSAAISPFATVDSPASPPDMILGPAADGGFYLIGARRVLPTEIFVDVVWSSRETRRAVMANAQILGLRVASLPHARDIDTLDDLQALIKRRRRQAERAPATLSAAATMRALQL